MSYSPARLKKLAGQYDNLMPESTIFPSQGLRIWSPNSFLISDVCIAEVEEYAYTDYNYENYKNYGDYYEEPDTEEKGKFSSKNQNHEKQL